MRQLRVIGRDTAVASLDAQRWRFGSVDPFTDDVVVEAPLTVLIRHRGVERVLGSTMRTPGEDDELAVGMAVGEGIVVDGSQVRSVEADPACDSGARVIIELCDDITVDVARLGRVSSPTSACGICGRDDLGALVAVGLAASMSQPPSLDVLAQLPERMQSRQQLFGRTGGLHAAGLADIAGSMICVREDVGRHNAVDKVIGWATLTDARPAALVVSGRAGFEIVQKAVAAGIPALVSVSATTSRAISAARASGLTLACFARDGAMTIYSTPADRRDPW